MKQILISKNIIRLINIPAGNTDFIIADDPIGTAKHIVRNGADSPFFLLFFLGDRELQLLREFISDTDREDVFARAVVFSHHGADCHIDNGLLPNILEFRTAALSVPEYLFTITKAFHQMEEYRQFLASSHESMIQLLDMKQDQEDLINIGKSLQSEKDPDKLLRLILFLSKKITGADAGSIYLIEELENSKKQMRFKYSHTFSKEIPIEEFILPYDTKSIAGYVAVTGTVLNLPDVYNLSESDPVSFNRSIDEQQGYQSRTMLVVPMRNHLDQIIGVIQLINSKEDKTGSRITGNEAFEIKLEKPEDFLTKVVPFDERYNSLLEAVASQAAIAIENNRMIKQIEHQFEEFVKASVTAIESRDVATSGHSFRVAKICTELARAVNSETEGPFAAVSFSETEIKEIEYASLLHDFGKVYIDLAIFMKGKKLFPKDYENVMLKINYLYRILELNFAEEKRRTVEMSGNPDISKEELAKLIDNEKNKLERIRSIKKTIAQLNEPTVTDLDPHQVLEEIVREIGGISCVDIEGNGIDVLTDDERVNLEIKRGSLNEAERREIESHVIHTYNFVSKIPWPPEFKNIPEIAAKHHEKLDGTGYPYGLKGKDQIPIQAQMMAIADIYDALTASDRPYKKSLPPERAISILKEEADRGKISAELFDLFLKYKIYERVDKDAFKDGE